MSFSYDRFIRTLTSTDRNIQIYGDDAKIKYTIMPYSVVSLIVSGKIIKVNLKSGRVISIDFSTTEIAKSSMAKLRLQLDELRKRTPLFVDKEIENYVSVNGGGGGTVSSITTTSTIYQFSHGFISPDDGSSYYIGDISDLPPSNVSSSATRVLAQVGGRITQVSIMTSISGLTGSGETQSFYIRNYTTGSQSTITESFVMSGISQINNYFIDELYVSNNDELEIIWQNPTYTISPTFIRHNFSVYFGLTSSDGSYIPGRDGTSGTSGIDGTSGYAGDKFITTSSDSRTIPSSTPVSMTFSVGANLAYSVNQLIKISSGYDIYMNCTVVSYNQTTGILTTDINTRKQI